MIKRLIPFFCLFHMAAIFWWTLPHSFGGVTISDSEYTTETVLLNKLAVDDKHWMQSLLQGYIDVTGSQQYWDFFAPQSPRFHQYLSVCNGISTYPEQERISCEGKPLFSNLEENIKGFKHFGNDRSRLYRLSENLINLEEPLLLQKFTQYYQTHHRKKITENTPAQLI